MITATVDQQRPYHVTEDGGLSLNFHPGQWSAWDATERFIFILAGTQGGKTAFTPHWLRREIYHPTIGRGGGDYLAVTATYDLFKLTFLPAMRELFETVTGDGRYWSGERIIELRNPTTGEFDANRVDDPMWGRIILRSADSRSGLESSTIKAAVLDECGMDHYTSEAWRAIQRRLSLAMGRVLGATTLYQLYNWLKQLYDKVQSGALKDTRFINFPSISNPAFPQAEYDRVLSTMEEHVINMMYRGIFDKPPGMIYSCFDSVTMTVPPFAIPTDWPAYGGMDYGGVNTVCLRLRQNPTNGIFYLTDEYHEGGKTAEEHTKALQSWGVKVWRGGAKSEGQWRREFRQAGLPVTEPTIADLWVGINRVYGAIRQGKLMIFDTCQGTLGQLGTYSRKIDKATGDPIPDEIANKEQYHYLDALRYILPSLVKDEHKLKVF